MHCLDVINFDSIGCPNWNPRPKTNLILGPDYILESQGEGDHRPLIKLVVCQPLSSGVLELVVHTSGSIGATSRASCSSALEPIAGSRPRRSSVCSMVLAANSRHTRGVRRSTSASYLSNIDKMLLFGISAPSNVRKSSTKPFQKFMLLVPPALAWVRQLFQPRLFVAFLAV